MTRAQYRPFHAVGAYSEGDMRPGPVALAYLDIAEAAGRWRGMTRQDRNRLRSLRTEAARLIARHGLNPFGGEKEEEAAEALGYVAEEAGELADAYLPPGLYAGSHEGDGACYGIFALDPEQVDDVPRVADLDDVEPGTADAYLVTDHGNLSRYVRDGRGVWRELWGIV